MKGKLFLFVVNLICCQDKNLEIYDVKLQANENLEK